ncbi:hypothetical protein [Nitrosomonas sp. wSCUT-2]
MDRDEFIEKGRVKFTDKIDTSVCDTWFYLLSKEMPSYKITGKYLFFSSDRDFLQRIAINEIENNGFHKAKIPLKGFSADGDYVLCLYYKDDSRKNELAEKYRNIDGISYRYWKSDQATRSGHYSAQFLGATRVPFDDTNNSSKKKP